MSAAVKVQTSAKVGKGRLDQLLYACAEIFTRRHLEPRLGGVPLWEGGLDQVVETAIAESGIPKRSLSSVDLARMLGVLKPGPKLLPAPGPRLARTRRPNAG